MKFLLEHLVASLVIVLSTLLLALAGYALIWAATGPPGYRSISSDILGILTLFGSLAGFACIGSFLFSTVLDWLQPVLRVPKWFLVLLVPLLAFFVACMLVPSSDLDFAVFVGALAFIYFPSYVGVLRVARRKLSARKPG